jgi:precorrin-2 dehydrogenase / sirohydrochlorin ferrochelatase
MSGSTGFSPRSEPSYYPISINLKGYTVLVVGAGQLALPVLSGLIDFGAAIDVVAPHAVSEIRDLMVTHPERISLQQREFSQLDRERIGAGHYLLVYACTNSEEENSRVLEVAATAKVLAHSVDAPDRSAFIVPSVLKRGHLKVAVSTDGLVPVLARAVRRKIEASLGTEIDKYVLFIRALREKLVELETDPQLGNPADRRKIARRLAESEEIFLALQRENFEEANHLVSMIIAEAREAANV